MIEPLKMVQNKYYFRVSKTWRRPLKNLEEQQRKTDRNRKKSEEGEEGGGGGREGGG